MHFQDDRQPDAKVGARSSFITTDCADALFEIDRDERVGQFAFKGRVERVMRNHPAVHLTPAARLGPAYVEGMAGVAHPARVMPHLAAIGTGLDQ
jgi:hypothetical protein